MNNPPAAPTGRLVPSSADLTDRPSELDDPDDFPQGLCGCGYEIVHTPDGWQHDCAPWFWGDDHDAKPT